MMRGCDGTEDGNFVFGILDLDLLLSEGLGEERGGEGKRGKGS